MPRVTLKDVAAHLGLTGASVSMGLRGHPSIPFETRDRIRAACEELGYRPDPWLSELASARWSRSKVSRGSVIAYIKTARPSLPLARSLTEDIRRQAATVGYHLEVFDRAEFSDSSKLQRKLLNRGITEVIFGPVFDRPLDIHLDWNKFICIQVLPGVSRLPLHSVVRDQFNVVTIAWRKAVTYGYSRIGVALLDHPYQSMDDIMRLCAVHACQNHLFAHLPSIPPFHFTDNNWREKDFIRWIHKNKIDAVIDFTDVHAYLLPELDSRMGYACLHLGPSRPYSGISDYDQTCAREAINLLHYCRRSYQWGIPQDRIDHVMEPTWVDGNSMPPKKADAPALP